MKKPAPRVRLVGDMLDRYTPRVRTIRIDEIIAAAYNPRKDLGVDDPEYQKLARSMDEFGYVDLLIWNERTKHLVGGHQRLKILKAQGVEEIEVVVVDLPLEKEKTLNLALNKISGEWDMDLLGKLLTELGEIPDFDVSLTGFDQPEIDRLLANMPGASGGDDADFDHDAALDVQKPAVTQPGELIELGRHRLLCGDSTKVEDVRRLMDGEKAILCATDPPYLVDYDGTNHPGKQRNGKNAQNKDWSSTYGVTWDDADANSNLYEGFIEVAVAEAVLQNAAWYVWHASKRQAKLEQVLSTHGIIVHCQIIWVKNRPVLTRTMYMWRHEPCFFGWKKGYKPPRIDGEPMLSTVWEIDTIPNGDERPDHPTPKPLEVFEIPMRQHTSGGAGAICYEPFAGSGTQIIAAEKLGRRCFAMEISPHYCDLIVRRWIHLVGEVNAPADLVKRYAIVGNVSDAAPAPAAPPPGDEDDVAPRRRIRPIRRVRKDVKR